MNYKLELNTQEIGSNVVFNNIIFDFFKVNIVERLSKNQSASFIIFKVRTLNNEIIKTKKDSGRVKLKGDAFLTYKKLVKVESATPQKLEAVKADYDVAQAEFSSSSNKYQASLSEVQDAIAQEAVVRAEIKRLESLLERHKLDVTYTAVTASYDGYMGRRTIEVGQMIDAGQVLAYIVNGETDKWVVANYKETQIENMKLGDTATFTADSYSNKTFKGVIISFSPATGSSFSLLPPDNSTGNYVKIVQRVPVRIRVTNPKKESDLLKAGMNVNVTIAKKQ